MTEAELIEEVARLKAELKETRVMWASSFLSLAMDAKVDEDFSYLDYILLTDPELRKRFKKVMGSSNDL